MLAGYLDVLAARLHDVRAAADAVAWEHAAAQIEIVERTVPGGCISALTHPSLACTLLGRAGAETTATSLSHMLRSRSFTPIGEAPRLSRAPAWLRAHGPGRPLTPDDWAHHLPGVESALDVIERCRGDLADFVKTCTRVVTLRQTDRRDAIGSWSTDELIGCTVLVNPEYASRPAWLAECLVHEAVHHCHGMFEVVRPFIRDPTVAAAADRYVSPWTGAVLTAKSLLAACLVWFSLAEFWERAEGAVAEEERAEGLRRSAHGFFAGDPAADVHRFAWALDPDVPELIANLQATARWRWRHVQD